MDDAVKRMKEEFDNFMKSKISEKEKDDNKK